MALQIAIDYFCFNQVFKESLSKFDISTILLLAWLIIVIAIKFFINALPEELLLRGFLWGHLRKFKVSELSILCIQAILFWAAHYEHPPGRWIMVLLAGLVFGVVAWKTRSLFMSSLVHTCQNSTVVFFD
jgi:membrane protease YdiL (CAAX protease family)